MAATNPRSATVLTFPAPAASQTSPLRRNRKTLFKTIALLSSLSLIVLIFLAIPILPSFYLISVSATPLSTTTNNATWNMSLKVSNPCLFWTISYDQSHVSLFYTDKDGDFESRVISETHMGPFVLKRRAHRIISPQLSVKTDSVGKLLAERIVKDQTQGLARFQVTVTFPMRIKTIGDGWRMGTVFCSDINIVFNKSESGVASDLPKKCKFVWHKF